MWQNQGRGRDSYGGGGRFGGGGGGGGGRGRGPTGVPPYDPPPFRGGPGHQPPSRSGPPGERRPGGGDDGTRLRLEQNGIEVQTNLFQLELHQKSFRWFQYHAQIYPSQRKFELDPDGKPVIDEKGRKKFAIKVDEKGKPQFEREADERKDIFDSTRFPRIKESAAYPAEVKTETSPGNALAVVTPKEDTFLTRHILAQLNEQIKSDSRGEKAFITDGTSAVYAPRALFTESEADSPESISQPQKRIKTGEMSYYGPSDFEEKLQPKTPPHLSQPQQKNLKKSYKVIFKRDHERTRYYFVRLTEAGTVSFRVVDNRVQMTDEGLEPARITQVVNTALRSAMMSTMAAFGRSPRMFYFTSSFGNHDQVKKLFGDTRNMFSGVNPDLGPILGLVQTALISGCGNVFVAADFGLKWGRREERATPPHGPVGLIRADLNGQSGYIAGVPIRNLHAVIPEEQRNDVLTALKGLKFHVRYIRGEAWVQKMKALNHDDEWISRNRKFRRKDLRLWNDKDASPIVWAADDPALHSFTVTERMPGSEDINQITTQHTVASYYKARYSLELKYPKMPLIQVGVIRGRESSKSLREFYPVEFLFQAFSIEKDANSKELKDCSLNFSDAFSSQKRIDHLVQIYKSDPDKLDSVQRNILELLSLRRRDEPITLHAKVLQQPVLELGSKETPNLSDGSFNIRGNPRNASKFLKPADLTSFCVLDFTGDSGKTHPFMVGLLEACRAHGLLLPSTVDLESVLRMVTVPCGQMNPAAFYNFFLEGIQTAKRVFLHDVHGMYSQKNRHFKTYARHPSGTIHRCFVIPIPGDERVGLILEGEDAMTHEIVIPDFGTTQARLYYRRRAGTDIDPFNAKESDEIAGHVFKFKREQERECTIDESKVKSATPLVCCDSAQVECPAIAFVYLPDKESFPYLLTKLNSNTVFGISSQVLVKKDMRSPMQYFSNVALKLNAKLSNTHNKSQAWMSRAPSQMGESVPRPWLREVPTLVIGIATASAAGADAVMAVVGAAALNDGCMRKCHEVCLQKKSPILSKTVLRQIIKSLATQYVQENNKNPERVVVYRSGGHDGLFIEIINNELAAIRLAFVEMKREAMGTDFEKCSACSRGGDDVGCPMCTPPVTIIVAQSDHSIRVVPKEPWKAALNNRAIQNVPSGTCLDESEVLYGLSMLHIDGLRDKMKGDILEWQNINPDTTKDAPILFESNNEERFDFLLVSYGGLKGTSRPVYYRVIWNENLLYRPRNAQQCPTPLDKVTIQKLTYGLSFLYATATKAPREVPVIRYSAKVANLVLSLKDYLIPNLFEPCTDLDDILYYRRRESGDLRVMSAFSGLRGPNTFEHSQVPFRPHFSA